MGEIILETAVQAPRTRVFDLSTSIDFHCYSAAGTQERAIAGIKSGLIGLNEEVTWRARHLFVWQELSVRVTEFERPAHFRDEMVRGAFLWMRHDHYFTATTGDSTLMKDVFAYEAPLGMAGHIVNKLLLERYFRRFLMDRNEHIRQAAETDAWQNFLPQSA